MKPYTISASLIGFLVLLFIAFSGCGKLEDPERAEPVGSSSGGIPLPIGPRQNIGSFFLEVNASPSSLPADGVTSSLIVADLTDSSGRPVGGYTIFFQAELGFFSNSNIILPPGPNTVSATQGRAFTNADGRASIFYFSTDPGSSPVVAIADINRNDTIDNFSDLFATTIVEFSPAPGVPGSGIAGIVLTTDLPSQFVQLGEVGQPTDAEPVTIFANVFDEQGRPVSAGVRIECSSSEAPVPPRIETGPNGQANFDFTLTFVTPGTFVATVTCSTVINGRTFTDSIDIFYIVIGPGTPTPIPTAAPVQAITFEVNPATLVAPGGSVTLSATVTDRFGNASSGADVSFNIDPSTNTCSVVGLPQTRGTRADGTTTNFSVDVSSGDSDTPCVAGFVASSSGVSQRRQVQVVVPTPVGVTPTPGGSPTPTPTPGAPTPTPTPAPGTPRIINLTLSPMSIALTQTFSLSATVLDALGNPVSNVGVTFALSSTNCTAFSTSPSLPVTRTANSSGTAVSGTISVDSASPRPCTATFTATSGGITSNSQTLTITP
jgi:hypothetical protein